MKIFVTIDTDTKQVKYRDEEDTFRALVPSANFRLMTLQEIIEDANIMASPQPKVIKNLKKVLKKA